FKNQGADGVVLDVSFAMGAGGGGATGGPGGPYTSDAALLAQVPSGSYDWGGGDLAKGLTDCSGAVTDLVNILDTGHATPGHDASTLDMPQWLMQRGFLPTNVPMPGTFQVGLNAEHTQATLPGGTEFNWGNDTDAANRGVAPNSGGAWMPGFTQHFYRPVSSGPGGTSPASAGGAASVNWDGIAQYESSGDWAIDHGEGPDVTGGLQIATATWLSHGGGAYAPKAYMASKAAQIAIAQQILNDPGQGPTAWPTTYRNHPELFGGQAPITMQGGGSLPGGPIKTDQAYGPYGLPLPYMPTPFDVKRAMIALYPDEF